MITRRITKKQLEQYRKIYLENRERLVANRIEPSHLISYFVEHYHPVEGAPSGFEKVSILNAQQSTGLTPSMCCFTVDPDVFVAIDRKSGFFHVECEDIGRMEKLWDDLFVRRGLSEEDLQNFVICAQYVLLTSC